MASKLQSNSIITVTFFIAILLTIMPLPDWTGWFRPLWVLMVLSYWTLALDDRIDMGLTWLLGILLDIFQGTLFGEHAVIFCCVVYILSKLRRKIRLVTLWQQALFIALLSFFYLAVIYYIQSKTAAPPGSLLYWFAVLTSAVLWPWVFVLLRDCRRRFKVV